MFQNPSADEIREMLLAAKTIAVVGLSNNPDRPSYRVAQAMQAYGHRIVPVRPGQTAVLGEKAYARLADLPETPDLVDVFRAPEHVPALVDECIALGVKRLWLQEGVVNETAAEKARAAGMAVVMDRCVWKDRRALLP
ncbi:MAG: CoA-binding protein [Candidatus Nitricoxidivorans perseverans]|uniref:CoA-binding protein n=1 Tax=Candidatus Nitricoxidivorans perseverans TaxID=2975601 RepID=A0AA49IVQ0_9PROT|nr:MAG: CoA-binding protein [Candidatus Nitricoxidivorans perseverans]